jgi:hypothetical protein
MFRWLIVVGTLCFFLITCSQPALAQRGKRDKARVDSAPSQAFAPKSPKSSSGRVEQPRSPRSNSERVEQPRSSSRGSGSNSAPAFSALRATSISTPEPAVQPDINQNQPDVAEQDRSSRRKEAMVRRNPGWPGRECLELYNLWGPSSSLDGWNRCAPDDKLPDRSDYYEEEGDWWENVHYESQRPFAPGRFEYGRDATNTPGSNKASDDELKRYKYMMKAWR